MKIAARDLRLRDVVDLDFDGPSAATVTKVEEDCVILQRPFIHTGDVEFSGHQVLWYTGIETINLLRSGAEFTVTERKDVR